MRQPLVFAIVGSAATLLQYAVLIAGVEWAGWRADLSSALGYALSSALNYACNYRFTFASNARHRDSATRFVMLAASGWTLNTLLMWLLTARAGWPYLPCQLFTTAAVLAWNYTLSSRWVYR